MFRLSFESVTVAGEIWWRIRTSCWKIETLRTKRYRQPQEKYLESNSMVVLDLNIQRHISVSTVRGHKANIQDDWMELEPLTTKSVSLGDSSRWNSTNLYPIKSRFREQDFISVFNFACLGRHLNLLPLQREVLQWIRTSCQKKTKLCALNDLCFYGKKILKVTQWSS